MVADIVPRLMLLLFVLGSYSLPGQLLSDRNEGKPADFGLRGQLRHQADSLIFTFSGGRPPYHLRFLREGEVVAEHTIEGVANWRTTREEILYLTGAAGKYRVQFTDVQKVRAWDFPRTLMIGSALAWSPANYLPWLLVGLALLGLLSVMAYLRSRPPPVILASSVAVGGPSPSAAKSVFMSNGKFKITKRVSDRPVSQIFNPEVQPEEFLLLALDEQWVRTNVTKLHFGRQAISALNAFLRSENTDKLPGGGAHRAWEATEAIPEIGGMLLGQHRADTAGNYQVSIEQFVPLEARVQNVYKVDIDPLSLARDLGKAQDDHPDLTVVGWFHTHPGHGLFLSQPDLKVHYGHFRRPYHFAMEIDSMTDWLDTAFFTYRSDGQMNNQQTRRRETRWFSWLEIEKFADPASHV